MEVEENVTEGQWTKCNWFEPTSPGLLAHEGLMERGKALLKAVHKRREVVDGTRCAVVHMSTELDCAPSSLSIHNEEE